MVLGGIIARVFHDAFADGQRKIEPAKRRIALLKPGDDAQRMKVVIEAQAVSAEGAVEGFLAGVAKGRMPDIVGQSQRFGKFHIQSQSCGHGARDLRDFESVGETTAEMVGKPFGGQAGEDLCLPGQAAKCTRVENTRGVARKWRAIGVRRLGMESARQRASAPPTAIPAGNVEFDSILSAVIRTQPSLRDREARSSGLVIPQIREGWAWNEGRASAVVNRPKVLMDLRSKASGSPARTIAVRSEDSHYPH